MAEGRITDPSEVQQVLDQWNRHAGTGTLGSQSFPCRLHVRQEGVVQLVASGLPTIPPDTSGVVAFEASQGGTRVRLVGWGTSDGDLLAVDRMTCLTVGVFRRHHRTTVDGMSIHATSPHGPEQVTLTDLSIGGAGGTLHGALRDTAVGQTFDAELRTIAGLTADVTVTVRSLRKSRRSDTLRVGLEFLALGVRARRTVLDLLWMLRFNEIPLSIPAS